MCYLNGTTDRDYTLSNRQAVHKYGKISLLTDDGTAITEDFKDNYQQTELERKFRTMREEEFLGKATIYLTFWSRMDTKKASSFLDEVAERIGFKIGESISRSKRKYARIGKKARAEQKTT